MLQLIIKMSVPTMFSMLVISMYNIVDSIFVAKLGQDALTAISLAYPVQVIILAAAVGTGIGINSLIARALGEKDYEKADNAAAHGVLLATVTGLLFVLLALTCTRPFMSLFTQNGRVLEMACDYTTIVFSLSIFSIVHIAIEKIIQATGNMNAPMLAQLIGAVTNIILDPIFIFGLLGVPKMGIRGAAIATVIGQMVSFGFLLWYQLRRNEAVKVSYRGFRFHWGVVGRIYQVGFPAIVMQSITSIMVMLLNRILIVFSDAAVSVLGVYIKLQTFVYMPVSGLGQGIMPIMGYSYGARNRERLTSCLKIATAISAGITLVGTALFLLIPRQLLGMFDATPEMLQIGVPALRMISLSFVFAALSYIFSTLFQAIGSGTYSLVISILRQLMVVPIVFILSRVMELSAVWTAFPAAEIVACGVCLLMLRSVFRRKIAPRAQEE